MQQRRLIAAAGAIILALGVAACGNNDNSGSTTNSSAGALTGTGPITLVTGKDTSGNLQNQLNSWNSANPDQKVTIIELPEDADAQRQQMIQNATTKSDAYTVLNLDVVWTAEFAANGWVEQLKDSDFPLDKLLPSTVETARYFKNLYAVPITSDGGMLYYRKDLLDAAGLKPPSTWDEMKAACTKVKATNPTVNCYAGQFQKYEGLTVNVSEAINSAGGTFLKDDGTPDVNSDGAKAGLNFLVNSFKDGTIPKEAITYKEEEGRRAFQEGKLLFHRNWPYVYAKAQATDGSSKIANKFGVTPLPGLTGPGKSTLGGHNYAISKFAKNKATALEFIKFMVAEPRQKSNLENTSLAPTWASLYEDAALQAKFPYLTTLGDSIKTATKRPEAVKYGDVTIAIQDSTYAALQGQKPVDQALSEMQTKLTELTKK
jgi:multiple sugar transport system substrate-binding protein